MTLSEFIEGVLIILGAALMMFIAFLMTPPGWIFLAWFLFARS